MLVPIFQPCLSSCASGETSGGSNSGGGFPVSDYQLYLSAVSANTFEDTSCTDAVEDLDDIACWHDLSGS